MEIDRYNIHEPIYYNIEKEVQKLSYLICFDDDQLDVYSPGIAELFLRIVTEIEALSIEIYRNKIGDSNKISYGNAIEKINKKFRLKETPILVIPEGNYFSNTRRVLYPFQKWNDGPRTGEDGTTEEYGGWGYAYQALKHNKLSTKYHAMKNYGTLKYLIHALSALFLLNIINGGSSTLIAKSVYFRIPQKNSQTGAYGVWEKTYPLKYKLLSDDICELINKVDNSRQKTWGSEV